MQASLETAVQVALSLFFFLSADDKNKTESNTCKDPTLLMLGIITTLHWQPPFLACRHTVRGPTPSASLHSPSSPSVQRVSHHAPSRVAWNVEGFRDPILWTECWFLAHKCTEITTNGQAFLFVSG